MKYKVNQKSIYYLRYNIKNESRNLEVIMPCFCPLGSRNIYPICVHLIIILSLAENIHSSFAITMTGSTVITAHCAAWRINFILHCMYHLHWIPPNRAPCFSWGSRSLWDLLPHLVAHVRQQIRLSKTKTKPFSSSLWFNCNRALNFFRIYIFPEMFTSW